MTRSPLRSRRRSSPAERRWRVPTLALVIAIVAFTGLGVWTYPSAAAWFAQVDQSKIIEDAASSTGADSGLNAREIDEAREYNAALESGAVLESNSRLPSGEGTAARGAPAYASVLNDGRTEVMSRLRIPSIDLDLPIYHGTSDETLLKGLGHLEGTSLPVGGEKTHSVITGHRGLAEATMFTNLDKVRKGDRFTLTTFGQVLAYDVVETKVVDPDDTESLRTESGRDLVTLVTCTPLGINTQRILVTAERVTPTPESDREAATKAPDIPGFPWWILIMATGLLAVSAYVWWSGRVARIDRAQRADLPYSKGPKH